MPSGRRASSASAPASTGTPAMSLTDSLPPRRGDPSRTVTRTGSSLRKNAAASPAIPPPMTTTCGVVPVVMAPSLPQPHQRQSRALVSAPAGPTTNLCVEFGVEIRAELDTIVPRGRPKGLKVPLSVEERVNNREAWLRDLAVEVVADDLDRAHSDSFGAGAE